MDIEQKQSQPGVRGVGVTRRGFLRGVAVAGAALPLMPLLAACGGDDDDDDVTPAGGGQTSGAATATTASVAPGGGTAPAGATMAGDAPTAAGTDSGSGTPKMGGTLKWYLPDDPPDLDPHMQTTSSLQWLCGMCYNGLLRFNIVPGTTADSPEQSEVVHDLAEDFEVVDELTYTFTVRQGVKFHDGSDLTTEDVAFSLNRIRDADKVGGFQRAYAFTSIESVEATDDAVVTIKLSEPYAALINQIAVAYTRIAPKAVIEANGDMKQVIVGTGPFKLDNYTRGQKVALVKNDEYWEEGIPYLDAIDITIMPDNSTQMASFAAGQIDIYNPENPAQKTTLSQTNPDLVMVQFAYMSLAAVAFNVSKAPFDDLKVRQALWYAVDQQQIIDIVFGGEGSKQRAVPAAYGGWVVPYDDLPLSDGPDIDKAKALLAEAGHPDGFEVQCKTVVRYTQQEATVITEQLAKIGVKMEIIDVEYGAFLEARNSGDFDMLAFSLSPFGDIEDFTFALYGSESSRNYGGWGNAELDDLFAQGKVEGDVDARKAIFADVQAILAENVWVLDVPMAQANIAWQPYVKDFVPAQNPERGLGFWHAWLDK